MIVDNNKLDLEKIERIERGKRIKYIREKELKMNKTQLCEKAKISTNAMARLGRNEDVRVEVLTRICLELGCSIDEIMEILPEK